MTGTVKQNKSLHITTLFAALLLLAAMFCTQHAHASSYAHPSKYAAFAMDVDTGLILHKENQDTRLHPASLTKMMTLVMIFDALDDNKIRMGTKIPMSHNAASMIPSKIGIPAGSYIRVKDAIPALATKSANDVAVAVAEHLGGSEKNFAKMMTYKARQFGMSRTVFKNASGLHHPNQFSTARDMARLSRIIVKQYSRHSRYFAASQFEYMGKTHRTHNKLMASYSGMTGLKTGYIRQSGFNLAASVDRDGRRVVAVVFGGKTGALRNERMRVILDKSYKKYNLTYIAKAPLPPHKPQHLSQTPHIATSRDMTAQSGRWAMLNTANDNSLINRMIGQGDYDIDLRNRIATGLIAISSHMGDTIPAYITEPTPTLRQPIATLNAQHNTKGAWAIQVGAFSKRSDANQALAHTLNKLPTSMRYGVGEIAPAQTSKGWIFRSRIKGYSKQAAFDACRLLHDCIPVSPTNTF